MGTALTTVQHILQGKQDVVLFDVPDEAWLSDFGALPLSPALIAVHRATVHTARAETLRAGLQVSDLCCPAALPVPTLESVVRLEKLTHMVVTHLSPKRIGSLREVLALRAKRQPAAQLELIMSNPALQLLRTSLGMRSWTPHLGAFTTL